MPTLNIKNERVYQLAHRLAAITGTSMTSVIEQALEEKLAAVDRRAAAQRVEKLARIDRLLDEMARRMGAEHGGADPTAFLYDDRTGLPR